MKKETENKIIEKLANQMKICNYFKDIIIIKDKKMPFPAGVNFETNELFINVDNGFMSADDIINYIEGLIIHEIGHVDCRLEVPYDMKTMKRHYLQLKRKRINKELAHQWLNIVYDLEIHYQFNQRNFITPKMQFQLERFLTFSRNYYFEKNPEDIILSVQYPQTKEQKFVKKIIENRSLDVVKKVAKLAKNKKLNGQNSPSKTILTPVFGLKEGKNKDKSKQDSYQKLPSNGIKIKKMIEQKKAENDIVYDLSNLGFSDEECNEVLKKRKISETINAIKLLKETLNSVIPNLEHESSMQKTEEKSKDLGNRMNGYKRLNDVSEITKNIEDMVTIGKYDVNEVRIPFMIDRKCKSNILIVRDVSGSVSNEIMGKIIRDLTVSLIQIAKKYKHNVGVIDFHSKVEPVYIKKEIITNNYNLLLLDCVMFKTGYNTKLNLAIDFINESLIGLEVHKETPLNVYIITDGEIDVVKKKINAKKLNLIGLEVNENPTESVVFNDFLKLNKGKFFKVKKENSNQMILQLYNDYRSK